MTRPLGTQPAYRRTPLSAEEKARGEANFSPFVAQVLVANGLWPMPEKIPLKAHVFGKIERDGYSVEKVYFQTFPGFYLADSGFKLDWSVETPTEAAEVMRKLGASVRPGM